MCEELAVQSVVCKRLADIVCYSTKRIVIHVDSDNFWDFISVFLSTVFAERGKLEARARTFNLAEIDSSWSYYSRCMNLSLFY